MNYFKIYDAIINNSKTREVEHDYMEVHHIKPASLCRVSKRYGEITNFIWDIDADTSDNKTKLTAREHFIAHWLLYKMYPSHKTAAAWMMMRNANKKQTRYTSKSYEYASVQFSKIASATASKTNERRLKDGTHLFLDSEFQRSNCKTQIDNGTHPFLGGEMQKANINRLVDQGTFHMLGKAPWSNPSTSEAAQNVWQNAGAYYDLWLKHECGNKKLATLFGKPHCNAHVTLLKKFKSGWVPKLDSEWVKYAICV